MELVVTPLDKQDGRIRLQVLLLRPPAKPDPEAKKKTVLNMKVTLPRKQGFPIVGPKLGDGGRLVLVVSAEKTTGVDPGVEAFFDEWLGRGAWPVIRPHRDYAGQVPDRAPMRLPPAVRRGCRRLETSIHVDAGGRVPVCEMDFACSEKVAELPADGVGSVWSCERLRSMREDHRSGRFDRFRLCPSCHAWDDLS